MLPLSRLNSMRFLLRSNQAINDSPVKTLLKRLQPSAPVDTRKTMPSHDQIPAATSRQDPRDPY